MKHLDSSHILAKIVNAKRQRLERSKMRVPEAIVRRMAATTPEAPSFSAALRTAGRTRIIAEIKKASPSKGVFLKDFSVSALAGAYTSAGAAAISVVTEEDFFQGNLAWIKEVRKSSVLPVLRKDFVFDAYQIYETRAAGASAVLLIVALLEAAELQALLELAREMKLDALVEVHDEQELSEALEQGAGIVGVNNRDLRTFEVDLGTSLRLAGRIPQGRLFVAESGIRGRADIETLSSAGAGAFLIGETLIASGDPAATLRGFL